MYPTYTQTAFFGFGGGELIVILLVVLIFVGPDHLPEVAQSMGRLFAEFKRASNEIRNSIKTIETDIKKEITKLEHDVNPATHLKDVAKDINNDIAKLDHKEKKIETLEIKKIEPSSPDKKTHA